MDIVEAIAEAGADLIELGIPFSDPLADGPTIQRSTQIALEQGMRVESCLELVAQLRDRGLQQPFVLMGYVNPILAFGVEDFITEAASVGVDGLIIPDLPLEEAGKMESACHSHNLALIQMLAPNSTLSRITQVSERARGFIYLVSLTGTTGARASLSTDLEKFIQKVRHHTKLPLAVGFGISTPQQAQTVGKLADGVIMGSALIDAVSNAEGSSAPQAAASMVLKFRQCLDSVEDS